MIKKKYILGKKLARYSKEKILFGPYEGTKFISSHGWSNVDFGPKYLGTYEKQIQKKIIYLKNKYKLKFFICSTDILKLPAGLNYIDIQSDLNIIHQHCMLPDFINVDRMIYLDSDTIAMTCISKLWEIDIGNKIIGAAILKPIPTFGKLVHIFSFNFKSY